MNNSHNRTELSLFSSALWRICGYLSTTVYFVASAASDFKINYNYMDINLFNWLWPTKTNYMFIIFQEFSYFCQKVTEVRHTIKWPWYLKCFSNYHGINLKCALSERFLRLGWRRKAKTQCKEWFKGNIPHN